MTDLCRLIFWTLVDLMRARATLEAEIWVLRQQINVLRRAAPSLSPRPAIWLTKRTFKVLRRRSDVEGRADMAWTLPEGDPRYATDFLPRMDGAGCPPGGGGASGSWWPRPRLCQELRTQELAGVLWPTRRRFEPSSSPSASDLAVCCRARSTCPKIPNKLRPSR
jgi:hypothetical protein